MAIPPWFTLGRGRNEYYRRSNGRDDVIIICLHAALAQPHPFRDSSFECGYFFYNPRMGNRLSERTRRTDQPYPQPGHPGDFSHQDGNRNPQPGHPGASLQQDWNRDEGTCLSIPLILSSMFDSKVSRGDAENFTATSAL